MKLINEIIIYFIKDYIMKDIFEKWIYEKQELESFLGKELYLDVITVDFSRKDEVIHLKNILKKYLLEERKLDIDEINDAYCERIFNSPDIEQIIEKLDGAEKGIYKLLFGEFVYPEYHEEVSIDLTNIKTEKELMSVISRGIGIYRFPMQWKWFSEYLADIDLPVNIKILGIDNIKRNFAGCYYLITNELGRLCKKKGCKVQYF